jgi:hypothetical protein
MIPEYKLYHGAVLADIAAGVEGGVTISIPAESGRLLNYVLDDVVGLQIKFATQRLRPWHFSFPEPQIESLKELCETCQQVFVVLVCRTDGTIALDARELLSSFASANTGQAWLRADRRKREMYRVYGPGGEFRGKFKVTVDPILRALKDQRTKKTTLAPG